MNNYIDQKRSRVAKTATMSNGPVRLNQLSPEEVRGPDTEPGPEVVLNEVNRNKFSVSSVKVVKEEKIKPRKKINMLR